MPTLSAHDKTRIAAKSGKALRSVDRAYAGGDMLVSTRESIAAAARALALPEPPPIAASSSSEAQKP